MRLAAALRSAWSIRLLSIGAVLGFWQIISTTGVVNRVVIPAPTDVARGFVQLIEGGYWWENLQSTMSAGLIALAIGTSLGLVLGVVLGTSDYVQRVLNPFMIAFQALPKIVIAPLFIGWLGFGAPSKIAIAVVICFFPVWVNTMVGMTLATADELTLLRSMRASPWKTLWTLRLPRALPLIVVGLKHATLMAFTGVLVAEILAGSAGGLGQLVESFSYQLLMPLAFAVIGIVIMLAVAIVVTLDTLERRLIFWTGKDGR
jgi:NitT/TauT family transport system permease protein